MFIHVPLQALIQRKTPNEYMSRIFSIVGIITKGGISEKEQLEQSSQEEIDLAKRIEHFRRVLEKNEILTTFDRCVFESIVEKVIIGEVDENGNTNPYKLTFIYKTEYSNSIQSKMHKQINRKRTQNDVKDLPSHPSTDTC